MKHSVNDKEPADNDFNQEADEIAERKAGETDNTVSETVDPKELAAAVNQAVSLLQKAADFSERMRLGDYLEAIQKPKRMLFLNFLFGVARGIGLAIGFTILGALIFYILNQLEILNLPLIGDFITQLMKYIDKTYGARV